MENEGENYMGFLDKLKKVNDSMRDLGIKKGSCFDYEGSIVVAMPLAEVDSKLEKSIRRASLTSTKPAFLLTGGGFTYSKNGSVSDRFINYAQECSSLYSRISYYLEMNGKNTKISCKCSGHKKGSADIEVKNRLATIKKILSK